MDNLGNDNEWSSEMEQFIQDIPLFSEFSLYERLFDDEPIRFAEINKISVEEVLTTDEQARTNKSCEDEMSAAVDEGAKYHVVIEVEDLVSCDIKEEGNQRSEAVRYICEYCGHSFTLEKSLKRHIAACHHTTKKKHHCPHCMYKATRAYDLKHHIINNHTKEKAHKCDFCDYSTSRQYNLKKHVMSRHSGVKPIKCPYCKFETANRLNIHIRAHHTMERPHRCSYCNQCFGMKHQLRNHIKAHHPGDSNSNIDISKKISKYQGQVLKCTQCEYIAYRPQTLSRHKSICHQVYEPYWSL